jgi:hypothetical protein
MTDEAIAATEEPVVPTIADEAEAAPPPQNFALAVPAGIAAAVAGAALWAVFTYLTGMELGLIAIAVGAMAGLAIRAVGKGRDRRFAILGAACAAFGCVLGIALSDIAILAKLEGVSLLTAFETLGLGGTVSLAVQAGEAMDLLFVAIAVWEGWKLAVHREPKA